MAAVTFEIIIKELNNKIYHPVYFIHGDEPYFIDQLSAHIENNVLTEIEKEFNQTILYGRDVDITTILSYAKQYPMMSNYQVVIVREAQDIKDLFPRKKKEDDGDEDMESLPFIQYLNNPQKSTVLVFCYKYKKVDKRTKTGKLLDKKTVFYESKRLYEDKVAGWISSYVKTKRYKISEGSAILLGEYLGTDLSKVSNELDKLMINVSKGSEITSDLIERNIGISKDFNVFELQAALGNRDFLNANRIVNYFGANPKSNPFVLTISTLNSFFNKIISFHVYKGKPGVNLAAAIGVNPFFMRDYEQAAKSYSLDACVGVISILHEYDLKSKGVNSAGVSEHDLLREMIYKILHPASLKVEA